MKLLSLEGSFVMLKELNIAKHKIISKEEELDWKFPYYMKIDSGEHKTEMKGVRFCKDIEEARKNFKDLKKISRKIVIQEQREGVEMIIGIKEDKVFGKMLLVGFGGINAEILKDVAFLALPVEKEDTRKAVEGLKLYSSLIKRKKYAVDKFISLAEEVCKVAEKKKIVEMDLNPVILDEKDAWVVDARVLI